MFSRILVTAGGNHDSFAHLRFEYQLMAEVEVGHEILFQSNRPECFSATVLKKRLNLGSVPAQDMFEVVLSSSLPTCEGQHFLLIDAGWRVDTKANPFIKEHSLIDRESNLIVDGNGFSVHKDSVEFVAKLLKRQGCTVEVKQ